jgi:tRNA-(ms[2]io[6]A)-hydroxylase
LTEKLSVLGLQLPTDPRWTDLAKISIEAILTDHAYCEQKAATNCISLIVQHPGYHEIVDKLSPIVTEEWGHFRMVLRELRQRGLTLGRQRKDEYVSQLFKLCRQGGNDEDRLLDKLLVAALIEARSCERFKLLSEGINDEELKRFYYDLMVAEAGHYRLFIDLANGVAGEEPSRKRWLEFLAKEAEIMKKLEVRGDRIH